MIVLRVGVSATMNLCAVPQLGGWLKIAAPCPSATPPVMVTNQLSFEQEHLKQARRPLVPVQTFLDASVRCLPSGPVEHHLQRIR